MTTEGWIRLIIGVIILIVLIVILIRFRTAKSGRKDSLDILKKRYEDGEISQEAYEEALRKRGFD